MTKNNTSENSINLQTLACPICKKEVVLSEQSACCSNCDLSYSRENNYFSFIKEELYNSPEEYAFQRKVIEFWGKGWEKRFLEQEHDYLRYDTEALKSHIDDDIIWQQEYNHLIGNEIVLGKVKNKKCLNIGCGAAGESLTLAHWGGG